MVPIMLSENRDTTLACLVATLPSAAFMLAYHVILKPRRREQRAQLVVYHQIFPLYVLNFVRFYRLARKDLLEERSNIHREIEETTLLLRETARKHTDAEKSKEGMSPRLIVRVAELC